MVDEKQAAKNRKATLATARARGKVTKGHRLALGQVEKSTKAGHAYIKKNKPKMTPVMKRIGRWAFPGLAKQTDKKNRMISEAQGKK